LFISILGDPYNSCHLWAEAARVLKPGSSLFFTTPAEEWAHAFRGHSREAEFLLRSGQQVRVPSIILRRDDQLKAIESAGLRVEDVRAINIGDLSPEHRAPKLLIDRGLSAPVVTAYRARRT
jgi:hypothetical protein